MIRHAEVPRGRCRRRAAVAPHTGAAALRRKPVLLVGFAILPVRAVLYTFSDDSVWLNAVQLLDGVGAGIFGALTPLGVADLMRGTGHYNMALIAVATVQGIGASLSGLAAGLIVDYLGYGIALLAAGAVAGVALLALGLAMLKTPPAHSAIQQPEISPSRAA
jgi:MFS family permease